MIRNLFTTKKVVRCFLMANVLAISLLLSSTAKSEDYVNCFKSILQVEKLPWVFVDDSQKLMAIYRGAGQLWILGEPLRALTDSELSSQAKLIRMVEKDSSKGVALMGQVIQDVSSYEVGRGRDPATWLATVKELQTTRKNGDSPEQDLKIAFRSHDGGRFTKKLAQTLNLKLVADGGTAKISKSFGGKNAVVAEPQKNREYEEVLRRSIEVGLRQIASKGKAKAREFQTQDIACKQIASIESETQIKTAYKEIEQVSGRATVNREEAAQ